MSRVLHIDLDSISEYEATTEDEESAEVDESILSGKSIGDRIKTREDVTFISENRDLRLQLGEQFNILGPQMSTDIKPDLKRVKTELFECMPSTSAMPSPKVQSKDQSTESRYQCRPKYFSSELTDVDPESGLTPLDAFKLRNKPSQYRFQVQYQCAICTDRKYDNRNDWLIHRSNRHPNAVGFYKYRQLIEVTPRKGRKRKTRVNMVPEERLEKKTKDKVNHTNGKRQKPAVKKRDKVKNVTKVKINIKKVKNSKNTKKVGRNVKKVGNNVKKVGNNVKKVNASQKESKHKSRHKQDKTKAKHKDNNVTPSEIGSQLKPNAVANHSASETPSTVSQMGAKHVQYKLLQKCKICSFMPLFNVMKSIDDHIRNEHKIKRDIDTYHHTVMITVKPKNS